MVILTDNPNPVPLPDRPPVAPAAFTGRTRAQLDILIRQMALPSVGEPYAAMLIGIALTGYPDRPGVIVKRLVSKCPSGKEINDTISRAHVIMERDFRGTIAEFKAEIQTVISPAASRGTSALE